MGEWPSSEEVLREQEDLPALCAERPLSTREIFSPNAYYGFDAVLKSYADWPADRPLKLIVPHGIDLDDRRVWTAEAAASLPVIVCPPREVRKYSQHTDKVVMLGATPFAYVRDLLPASGAARAGTLFFLSHSTHRVTAVSAFEELADWLEQLPARFQPVSVCIYWRDFLLGHHQPFAARGMRIVSAGHMYDPRFLARLYWLCSVHRYACSNEYGSHLFYSVHAGCAYFHIDLMNARYVMDTTASADVAAIPEGVRASLEQLFGQPRDTLAPEQVDWVAEYMGSAHKLSRAGMREFFECCEMLDRVGLARWDGRLHRTYPRAPRRWLWEKPMALARHVARSVLRRRTSAAPAASM